ncbi:MAG TPA: homoserine dehydrogenase [Thermoanaerobaculia bacterium]|nr:homoserine dehydrogenase [Thermoanaerobaculia bacterium]
MRPLRIGLLGCGTVGAGFVRLVARERERIRERYGIDLDVARILVRDITKERADIDRALLTNTALDVLDADCDLIVEAIGGVHTAGSFVRRAIARGHDVVTANKALLAECGRELLREAEGRGVAIGFEASVCGGVPVIGALRHGLAGDTIERITGILNGTCNYILSRMDDGFGFAEALACAQERGFAEADPSLDLSGEDAAQKLRILADVAFDVPVRSVRVCGIDARTRGKLVAEATRVAGGVDLVVEPRTLHPFASVVDEQNAVIVHGRAVGEIWLSGRGAGSMPTAAALLADVLEISSRASRAARPTTRWPSAQRVSSGRTAVLSG